MASIKVAWADNVVREFGERLERLAREQPVILPRIINQVGARAKTQVVRALTKQTGLPRATIVKAVGDPTKAGPRKLSYEMVTRGGNIRLKYLNPSETEGGVVARPFGKRTLFPGAFLKGGAFPNRKDVGKFGGHAFYRLNPSGTRITYARSGVVIPNEMTTGATRDAFERTAAPLLRERVERVLMKYFAG